VVAGFARTTKACRRIAAGTGVPFSVSHGKAESA
jgi:hypothetical protein